MSKFRHRLKQLLLRDKSGVMLIEFAYTLPLVFLVVMSGTELAHYAMAQMSINQTAIQIVDNASRMGDDVSTATKPITEGDVDDVLIGGGLQFDTTNSLYRNGRVILSSVEPDPDNAGRYRIRWQRCRGQKAANSTFGVEGANDLANVGPTGRAVTAPTGGAVMFVEIIYDYVPFFLDGFLDTHQFHTTAAMIVRDPREYAMPSGTEVLPAGLLHNSCSFYRLDGFNPST